MPIKIDRTGRAARSEVGVAAPVQAGSTVEIFKEQHAGRALWAEAAAASKAAAATIDLNFAGTHQIRS